MIARLILSSTLLGAIILVLCAKPLVYFLFGSAFLKSVNAIIGLIPGVVLVSLSRALANDIAARGHPELNTITSIFVVIINILLNVILIPFLGILGAALATSISYTVNAALKLFLYSHLSGNQWWKPLVFRKNDILTLISIQKK